jgi:hypothetical protein
MEPGLSPHYQAEYTLDKSTNPALWNSQNGLHAVFGSTDDLYFRTEAPQLKENLSWSADGWRGERLNAQIVIWSADSLEQVRLVWSDLVNQEGNIIAKQDVEAHMVRYMLANYPYNSNDANCGDSPYKNGFLMPDRFEKFDRFDVPAKTVRPVWLTIDIPADARPGLYSGTVEVMAKGFRTVLKVEITVQNQTLPKPHDWKFRLDLWQNPWVLAWHNHLQPWSAEHKLLLRNHLKLYADAGGKYITTYAVNSPWSDNSYSVEGAMIESERQKDGSWKFDYKIFDEYVELAMSVGIDKAITIYTPIPGQYRFRYLDKSTGDYITEFWPPESEKFKAYWTPFLNNLRNHLQQKGWLDKTYIGINENPMDETLTAIKFIRNNWRGWQITYAGDWHPELNDLLNDYSCVSGKESPRDIVRQRKARGYTTTFYVCCQPPKPNTFLFSPPIEGQWIGWYASAFGYSGFLRWAYDAWPEDPNRDARHGSWPAGDCYLVYPGANSGIRFEKLREGISDYEKIRILRNLTAASTDEKSKALMQQLDALLGTIATEHGFNEATLKKQVADGEQMIKELSNRLAGNGMAQSTVSKVICRQYEDYKLTHNLTPFGPVPTAFDPNGVYPYVSYCETSNRPVLQKYHYIVLENDQLKVTICPDLGGKVTSIICKRSGKEVLYVPDVIRQTRILPRFYFTAGGIEVSFPISHSPSQNERVNFKVDRMSDRIYVTCGERELRFGMQWSVEYSLGPKDDFLTERAVFYNPGTAAYPWMSWSNAAIPAGPDTRFYFPRGRVLSHSSEVDTIDWEKAGPRTQSDIKEMTGYFWETKDANAFGAYTPSSGTGLYHVAAEAIAPGMKLWSYGVAGDTSWSMLSTARRQQYIELQGGPIGDQSIKLEIPPKETRSHTEYWIPADHVMDIYQLKVPAVPLRPVKDIPLFEWARPATVTVWEKLARAYQQKSAVPSYPPIDQNLWPPSGMENLDAPFKWAILGTNGDAADHWRFYYGAWLAGRGNADEAIQLLSAAKIGLAKVLLARLLAEKGDLKGARIALDDVKEPWLQLHPQVIIERDKILRSFGTETLAEREKWLSKVDALKDEFLIERKVQLLIDEDRPQTAKDLLLSFPFQMVHQTYTRTDLWVQICKKINIDPLPVPRQLGEDRLAIFGAYREYKN